MFPINLPHSLTGGVGCTTSQRAYQAMMVGCIPVILADEIEFPFENSLHWPSLTVKIAEADSERVLEVKKNANRSPDC